MGFFKYLTSNESYEIEVDGEIVPNNLRVKRK